MTKQTKTELFCRGYSLSFHSTPRPGVPAPRPHSCWSSEDTDLNISHYAELNSVHRKDLLQVFKILLTTEYQEKLTFIDPIVNSLPLYHCKKWFRYKEYEHEEETHKNVINDLNIYEKTGRFGPKIVVIPSFVHGTPNSAALAPCHLVSSAEKTLSLT